MYFSKYDHIGEMHFLLISENEFFYEIKCDGITRLHGIRDKDLVELVLFCASLTFLVIPSPGTHAQHWS